MTIKTQNPFENFKILVLDQNVTMCNLVKGVLETFGFENVTTISDGEKGLYMADYNHFDIIICDWNIQNISGIEFTKRIRHNKACINRFVPIIMVTAKNTRSEVKEARDAGVTEFIMKPFTVDALKSRIVSIIDYPRNFIISRNYIGHDRRRRKAGPPKNIKERRKK